MKRLISFSAGIVILSLLIFQSCNNYHTFRSNYNDANTLLHQTDNLQTKPFLKAHLKNGDVIILEDKWAVDTVNNYLAGFGSKYNYNRKLIFTGNQQIKIDSISIFETNTKLTDVEKGRVGALMVVAGLDVVMAIVCLTNPKACFGSCPTFYLEDDVSVHYADAEGFSNAILPSMEYGDIDAIGKVNATNFDFSLIMKNEALETHCINELSLMAYPIKADQHVYHSFDNKFYLSNQLIDLSEARAAEGDITHLVNNPDKLERFSLADENNLNSREEIFFEFALDEKISEAGLIIHFRQSLMTTYLFYSALGYMGNEASDLLARLENDQELQQKFDATTRLMGGIEVYVWHEDTNEWKYQGELNETGPIAINKQLVPLQNIPETKHLKLKLLLNKGLWRLDYLALAALIEEVTPIELKPIKILNKGLEDNEALNMLAKQDKRLVSLPGAEYKIYFENPGDAEYFDLFLYAKGYYLEWMRENWLKEKNIMKLRQMVYQPNAYLKSEAAEFKKYEATMEQEFWNSRIDTKTFVMNEN
ncbi:MAG TPA: hypothetical protein PKC24_05630 [Cyclobacteriaceae bacterium]|nr:hypothetical protein [Cyclobacteriaceae bacterium]